jgi:tetratricopeptide (TPR) repeat protein
MKAQSFGCVLCIGMLTAFPVYAQISEMDRLNSAARLNDRGKFLEALSTVEPLLASSGAAGNVVTGVAWNIRGLALEHLGNLDDARRSYETAIEILHNTRAPIAQYASALDNLGSLKADVGDFEESQSLRLRARQLYQSSNDHAGMARTSVNLALLALARRDKKHTRQFLADAWKEEALVPNPNIGEVAALHNVEAVERFREGHLNEALKAIGQAIRLWTEHYGPQHYLLATGLCLRGQIDAALKNEEVAKADLSHALDILRKNNAMNTRAFFAVEKVYSAVLRSRGEYDEADRLAADANRGFEGLRERRCSGCTISAEGFR